MNYYKGHGEDAANALRRHFSYGPNQVPSDVHADFRRLGFHVFRRRLENSNISGLTIQHPTAGTLSSCTIPRTFSDRDLWPDTKEDMASLIGATIIVTFRGQEKEYVEIRANAFASHYVLPCELITHIPVKARDEIVKCANRLEVSTHVLAIALILYQRTTIG